MRGRSRGPRPTGKGEGGTGRMGSTPIWMSWPPIKSDRRSPSLPVRLRAGRENGQVAGPSASLTALGTNVHWRGVACWSQTGGRGRAVTEECLFATKHRLQGVLA